MADWVTISSLATAGGTMVLALATFASVRSSRRSAGVTERALLAQIRPVLVNTRSSDPAEKVGFGDAHWMKVEGQRASFEITDEALYLAFTVRNVGAGVAVLDRWDIYAGGDRPTEHRPPDEFRRLTRDIFIPADDLGFWQGAVRDPDDPQFKDIRRAIEERSVMQVDLLYEDHEGGQRTISRFAVTPVGDDDVWLTGTTRHWNLDRPDPRDR
jgi:hypothetical protein